MDVFCCLRTDHINEVIFTGETYYSCGIPLFLYIVLYKLYKFLQHRGYQGKTLAKLVAVDYGMMTL